MVTPFVIFVILSVEEPCVVCMYAEINDEQFCLPGCNAVYSVESHPTLTEERMSIFGVEE
jgi:predicted nucleic acid-binding Zn ribbon protein